MGPGATTVEVPTRPVPRRVSLRHMPGLDGLRGLAVLGVLLFHGGMLVGGFLGVDLFFVLSGFLITSLLLREVAERGTVSLRGFWTRRARRLLPALVGLLFGVAAYAATLVAPGELARIRADGFATLAYVANWREIFAEQDYWAMFQAPSPLQHMWSVAIEEQFYLVWPLLVVGLVRLGGPAGLPRRVLGVAGALSLCSLLAMVVLYDEADRSRVYFGTDTRAASILVGVALAAWVALRGTGRSAPVRWGVEAAGLTGAAVLAVAWSVVDGRSSWLYRGGLLGLAVASVAVIGAAAAPEPKLVGRVLAWAPLRWLGMISYGAYLWHWPLYLVVDEVRTGLSGWPLLGVRVAATIAVAALSYAVLEQPIRRGALPGVRLAVLTPVVGLAVVVALVTATGVPTSPSPVPSPPPALAGPVPGATQEERGGVEAAVDEVEPDTIEAAVAAGRAAPPGAERVMVVGNSVGLYLGDAMQRIRPDPPVVAFNRALVGCTFPLPDDVRLRDGTPYPQGVVDCTESWDADVAALDPDLVVVALSDPGDADYRHHGDWLHPCQPAYDRLHRAALTASVHELGAGGATVALVTPGYAMTWMAGEARFERTDCVNRVMAEVAEAEPQAVLVDIASFVCPGRRCRTHADGVELRPDGLHYLGEGALLVAERILEEARAARMG